MRNSIELIKSYAVCRGIIQHFEIKTVIDDILLSVTDVKLHQYGDVLEMDAQLVFIDGCTSREIGMVCSVESLTKGSSTIVKNTVRYRNDVEKLYKAYEEWYNNYLYYIRRGHVILAAKPNFTINAFMLLKYTEKITAPPFQAINTALYVDSKWHYIINLEDQNTIYMPYIREYSKRGGKLIILSTYHPDNELCTLQYIAYPVASDMHFAMLECCALTDVSIVHM